MPSFLNRFYNLTGMAQIESLYGGGAYPGGAFCRNCNWLVCQPGETPHSLDAQDTQLVSDWPLLCHNPT